MMTVSKLIKKLQALPQGMDVLDIDLEKLGVMELAVDYPICRDLLKVSKFNLDPPEPVSGDGAMEEGKAVEGDNH